MKFKIICTLSVLIGLCATSCRSGDEMDYKPISIESKTINKDNMKLDSATATSIENETNDPPKTEQQWKQKDNKQK